MKWQFDPVTAPTAAPTQYSGAPDYVAGALGEARTAAEAGANANPLSTFGPPAMAAAATGAPNPVTAPAPKWTMDPVQAPQAPYSARQPGYLEQKIGSGSAASKEVFGRVADIATGANDTLAGALSSPAAAVANVFRGALGKDLMTSNDMKKTMQDALSAIPGMGADKTKAFNNWWADLGDKGAQQALMTMALIAGAPALASGGEALGGTAGSVMKNVGEAAITHPGMVAAADTGSVIGGAVLPEAQPYLQALGIDNPALVNPSTLALLGNLLGGPIGASISTLARIRPTGLTTALGNPQYAGLPRFGGSLVREAIPGAKPLLGEGFTADDIGNAVKGTQQEVTSWMQDRIAKITKNGTLDPAVQAERVRAFNHGEAYDKVGQIEDQMWGQVNQNRPVSTKDVRQAAIDVAKSASDPTVRKADIPGDNILDIMKWKPNEPMTKLRDMSRLLRKTAATIGMSGNPAFPSDVRAANLTKLANAIDDSITNMYPNDIAMAKAKAFTKWKHDQFSGGSPMAQLAAVRANTERLPVDASTAMKTAMADSRFPGQTADVGATTGLAPEMQARSEDYLRSMVGDAYRTGSPKPGIDPMREELAATTAAKNYMQSPDFKRFAKAFPAMDAVFQRYTNQLVNATGKAAEIAKSKFFNLAGAQPEQAVDHLFGSGTKVQDSKMIMDNIGKDRKAVDALEYGMIRKLGNSVNWDPESIIARLQAKDLQKAFINVMGQDRFNRMNRIFETGAKLQNQEAGGLIGMSPTKTAGRILGSFFTGISGGKSIQVHSIGTKIGGNLMQRIFHTVPPEQFIQKALTDPNWERFLMSKLPENMEGFKITTRLVGLLASGVEAGHRNISLPEGKPSFTPTAPTPWTPPAAPLPSLTSSGKRGRSQLNDYRQTESQYSSDQRRK